MALKTGRSFYQILTAAIADLTEHGFDSQERLDRWMQELAAAARAALIPEHVLQDNVRDMLTRVYRRLAEGKGLVKAHAGVSEYTLAAIKPKLRAELDRRILASANLIKLNREASIQRTLQRFAGWATSIPAGGSDAVERQETAANVRRSIAGLPFEERRVVVDQGHKLSASLSQIVAVDGGAIAGVWHSHWRESGYNYRERHRDRDQNIYVLRGNWALKAGLIKLTGHQYYDEITAVGEEVYCRCYMTWLYNLRDLPSDMLTEKGRDELARVRMAIAGM